MASETCDCPDWPQAVERRRVRIHSPHFPGWFSLSRSIDTQSLHAEYNNGKLHFGANVASRPVLKATA